jgi:hypothetical protein
MQPADIDGVSQIAPWWSHIAVPRALYDNLTIVHVEPCTRKRLANFLRCLPNRREHVAWMKEVVKANMGHQLPEPDYPPQHHLQAGLETDCSGSDRAIPAL